MGTPQEFSDMLTLFESHHLMPTIEHLYSFDEFKQAYACMRDRAQFGKLVLLSPNELEETAVSDKRDE